MSDTVNIDGLIQDLDRKLRERCQKLDKQDPKASADEACKELRTNKEAAIYWTVRCEDHDLLKQFLAIPGLNANLGKYRDGGKSTELHWAARLGNAPVLSLLLGGCSDHGYVEIRNKAKETALYDGVRAQCVDVVRILLGKGAKVMISNMALFSPLHLAAKRQRPAIVQLIWEKIDAVDRQSSLGACTNEGMTALHHAVRDGHTDTVKLLLNAGADPNPISHEGKRPLHTAASRGNPEILDLLWHAGAATNATTRDGYTILHCAAECGQYEAIRKMIISWTQSDQTHEVSEATGQEQVLSTKVAEIATPKGSTKQDPQATKAEKPRGMPLDSEVLAATVGNGFTALHLSIVKKNRESAKVVGLFLDKLDPNIVRAQTNQGETIFHLVAQMRRSKLLDELARVPHIGKMLEAQTMDGSTALHQAIKDGSWTIQERLMDWMGDTGICQRNHDGETALHLAARKRRADTLEKLLLKMDSATIAVRNHYGETALHIAATFEEGNDQYDMTAGLLARMRSEDITLVNDKGESAFTKAALQPKPSPKIIELFVKYEADVPNQYETRWAPMDQQARLNVSNILLEVLRKITWTDYSSHTSWQMIVRWAARNGDITTVRSVLDVVPEKFIEEVDKQEQKKSPRRGSTVVKGEQMPSAPRETALFWAALGGHRDIVDLLLRHQSLRAYYHLSEKMKDRCLRAARAAARNGHLLIVKTIIQHMQPPGDEDRANWNPLDLAIEFGDPEIVQFMLIKGVELPSPTSLPTKSPEIKKLLEDPQPTPRWYSRESTQAVWSSRPQLSLEPFKVACGRFKVNLIDFYFHDGALFPLEMAARSIYEVIYDPTLGPNRIMKQARQAVADHPAMDNAHRFRWIHLPANNWKWVQDLMKRICFQTKREKECWLLQKFAEANRREHVGRPQSRFMFPDVRIENSKAGKRRNDDVGESNPARDSETGIEEFGHLLGRRMAIYMPFITIESLKEQELLQNACKEAAVQGITTDQIHALENLQHISTTQKDDVPLLSKSTHDQLIDLNSAITAPNWSFSKGTTQVLDRLWKAAERSLTLDCQLSEIISDLDFSGLDLQAVIAEQKNISGPDFAKDPLLQVLLKLYLRPGEPNALHIRRSLDQYYYPALPDDRTECRDGDQVVYRFQRGKFRKVGKDMGIETTNNLRVCTVDQLWLWVIDERTVITCFPQRWSNSSPVLSGRSGALPDPLEFIRDRIHNDASLEISSVYHLATLITSLCTAFVDQCTASLPDGSESFLQIFANAIGIESDDESSHFEKFKEGVKKQEEVSRVKEDARIAKGSNQEDEVQGSVVVDDKLLDESLKISAEIDCLNEIKDIRDELKIISSVFSHQKFVLGELQKEASRESLPTYREADCPHSNYVSELPEYNDLETRYGVVKKMEDDAEAVYGRLNHLLDLKQKHANFLEAALARKQAQEMAKQTRELNQQAIESGREAKTILFLTFVTIVFAPMSFLTSLYALNVSTFSAGHVSAQDSSYSSEWLFSRVFGISTAVAVPLILLALFVGGFLQKTPPSLRKLWERLTKTFSGGTEHTTTRDSKSSHSETQESQPSNAAKPFSKPARPSTNTDQAIVSASPNIPQGIPERIGLGISNSTTEIKQTQANSSDGSFGAKESAKSSPTIIASPRTSATAYEDVEGGAAKARKSVFSRVLWGKDPRGS